MKNLHEFLGSWNRVLKDVIENSYVVNNLNVINIYYKYGRLMHPNQVDVFNAFKYCPYDKLSVVILGQDPYHDSNATGLAFANPTGTTKLSPSLQIIKDTVIRTIYKGESYNFDPTLIPWAEQGVLLLNVALTSEGNKPLAHNIGLWRNFTEGVLRKLSEVNSGIIYCLWGKYADSFSMFINSGSNTILRYNHPAYSVYQGIPWECNHFVQANEYLKNFNNKTIIW